MKKILLIILFFPLFSWGQFSIGNNQMICLSDTAQIAATLAGTGTTGCSGVTDILGQETTYRKNTPLLYIYDDGTVEKRIVIE